MSCKLAGKILRGPYAGQEFWVVRRSKLPRWVEVHLIDENGHHANREVREQDLETA